jgi:hypothetical protein
MTFANIYTTLQTVYLKNINESKLMVGFAMILLNIGTRYIDLRFTKTQEQMLRNSISREILIFAVVFMGTRDILLAILLTAAFIVLSEHVFNDKSKYCMFSNKMKQISTIIDANKDDIISPEEEQRALDTLRKAEKTRNRDIQGKFNNYLKNINFLDFNNNTNSNVGN